MPENLNALDRELSELFEVEPSPEFAAQVRARIEAASPGPFVSRWWMGAVAVSAVVVIAIAVATIARRAPAPQGPTTARGHVQLSPPTAAVAPAPTLNVASPSPHATRRLHTARRDSTPEVLIDPTLAAAVRRLTTEQRVLPEMPPEPSLAPVVVEPLKVPDIANAGTKQGLHP